MAKETFTLSVTIEPIPTGAGGIVRGRTITIKGGVECTKHTSDDERGLARQHLRGGGPLRPVRAVREGHSYGAGERHAGTEDVVDVDHRRAGH